MSWDSISNTQYKKAQMDWLKRSSLAKSSLETIASAWYLGDNIYYGDGGLSRMLQRAASKDSRRYSVWLSCQ
jgi:hypothetical protein